MNIPPERVIAYFQPVFSAASKSVYSYEILGRFIDDDGNVQSLGTFFNDSNTTNEEALQVDRIVRKYAMRKYAEEKRSEYLFINIRLAWLTQYTDNPSEILTLQWAKEFGISPDKLVIEITEEDFNTSDEYLNAITYYKNVGSRIALDDCGKNASNIDRLAKLQPDIIKINMDYIHSCENSYHYREYLRTTADFADSVGIEVLYEGVETQRQLDICMSLNGRYYQGFLIARPQSSMRDAVINDAVFSASIENAYMALQDKIIKTAAMRKFLDAQVERFLAENPFDVGEMNYDAYLEKLCRKLPDARLVYVLNRRGEQLAYSVGLQHINAVASAGAFERADAYQNKNWAWRRYFYDALKFAATNQKSCLSSNYYDFATKDRVRTYSYAISDDAFLFVDIDEI